MAILQHTTDEWLAVNRHRMVNCLYQPGNLIISKQACRARKEKAKKENFSDNMQGDFLDYIHKKGLAVCLTCKNGHGDHRKTRASSAL